ncbi:hypothetical protein, conserved [Eimeria tenella]|uniref:non-specific serine/threonine protein kinase n=1 Tax=Eimeria tenella TaxID=5802 RepID=U6KZP9_EIMTE|nr:hypothetical protein, conserved [Eimeria tenella]CDJ43416.1 hypothetical protein, conserved [Eimeria tenella]|eukprot:XP_013234166.1 hypothetical protein, conserved [Eimeria tenella]
MPIYKKVTLLGSGSFGKAFLVIEKGGDGTKLVLKSIDMSGMDAVDREETLNEVFASIPPHPFIVRYRRSYILEDQLCIIMEHCADLKPQNLFLNERDDLLIGDFGIAKMLDSTHCCAKTTIGTPYYFSPELCQGSKPKEPCEGNFKHPRACRPVSLFGRVKATSNRYDAKRPQPASYSPANGDAAFYSGCHTRDDRQSLLRIAHALSDRISDCQVGDTSRQAKVKEAHSKQISPCEMHIHPNSW